METHFASAERSVDQTLEAEIIQASTNALISSLMNIVSGLLLVLNKRRQIVAINETFLQMLGIDDPEKVLGVRPGEAIECIHANLEPGGCGTSEYCSSCGAAIAIVSCLSTNEPAERKCAVTVELSDRKRDLYFNVRAVPVTLTDERFVLLFMHDISNEQRWALLERVFFHDISNVLQGLVGKSELLAMKEEESGLANEILDLSTRLAKEIGIQRSLFYSGISTYSPVLQSLPVSQILSEIKLQFSGDAAAAKRTLVFSEPVQEMTVKTDISLVTRVLGNMLRNAIEASDEGDEVRLSAEREDGVLAFCVWNRQPIPPEVSKRIFQRNFSTKEGTGRGLGTYSMKLFGEDILGGTVDFWSSEASGTVFRLRLKV